MPLTIHLGQYSHPGPKTRNDDCYGALIPQSHQLASKGITLALADGISQGDAGREAADTCIRTLLFDYYATPESWTVKTSVERVLQSLNRWLYAQGQSDPLVARGLICTLSVLVLKGEQAHLFHVGDTRIYRLRDGKLNCLTQDHRFYLNAREHQLTRAMGADMRLELDYHAHSLREGDLWLICSDGVHDFLQDQALEALLLQVGVSASGAELDGMAQRLVEEALAHGSNDNLSCQLVRVLSVGDSEAEAWIRDLAELPFPPPLEAGMRLDHYRVLGEVHASSRSQLYRVLDLETGQERVVKTPSVNFEDDSRYIERFIWEEWIGRRLNHPNLMKIFPSPARRSALYWVGEYLPGLRLSDWIRQNPKPELQQVLPLTEALIKGIRALHRHDILHQDLKPDNVMILPDGQVKIIDFGAVRVGGLLESYQQPPMDRPGTQHYMAPEYLQTPHVDWRADLYALAVLVYEMLTGRYPFGEQQPLGKRKKARYLPARHFHPLVPEWMDGALEKALSPQPQRRYDSLSDFWQDLTHPNPRFISHQARPLLEREPLLFWRLFAFGSLLFNLILLFCLLRSG